MKQRRKRGTSKAAADPFKHTPPDPAYFSRPADAPAAPVAPAEPRAIFDQADTPAPLDIPDDDAVPEHRLTHVERINRATRGTLAMLAFTAGAVLASPFGWAQPVRQQPQGAPPPPLTITEAMLGRCTADAVMMRDQTQQTLATVQAEAMAKAAYWDSYVKGLAPESAAPR